MAKVDPTDFLLNTDYEMDKIVLFKQGSFTSTATINHGLIFTPLVFGVWSTDENFNSVNTLGWQDSSTEPGYSPVRSVECYATDTEIKLTAAGNNGTTLYYRIYGFEPSNSHESAPTTSNKAYDFVLNTDYNYRKLYKTGIFTQDNEEFAHNLGYIPQVMAWIEYSLGDDIPKIQPLDFKAESTAIGLTITATKIKTGPGFSLGILDKLHWRIYCDEA